MSEEVEFSIRKLEDGEITAMFSSSKSTLVETDKFRVDNHEECTDVDRIEEDGQYLEQQTYVKDVTDDDGDNLYVDDVLDAKENNNESDFQYRSNDNLNFAEPALSSTPVMTRETSVELHCVSDKIPLLKNWSGVDGEGDNDNTSEASCGCSYDDDRECNHITVATPQTRDVLMIPGSIRVPIAGHETMEARSKFTVFKIHVMVEDDEIGWFIFRRYSDFVHLNDQLILLFPSIRFTLPPKRWFKSNFDVNFLDERKQGLQAYVDNVTGHRDMCNSKPVRDFFCFDDPPGPHDSLEESRAQCECMEEMVYLLRKELTEKDTEIDLLKDELDLYKNQVQLLSNRLSELNRLNSVDRPGCEKYRFQTADRQFSTYPSVGSADKQFSTETPVKSADKQFSTEAPVGSADGQFSTEAPVGSADGQFSTEAPVGSTDGQFSTEAPVGSADGQFSTEAPVGSANGQLSTEALVRSADGQLSNAASIESADKT